MATTQFIFDGFKTNLLKGNIDLDGDTLKIALLTDVSPSYSARANSTAYSANDIVIPATRNGHRYICTTAGTSAASAPSFSTTDGAEITDGTVTWTEYGGEIANNEFFDDIDASEVASGDGYTTGGATLASVAISQSATTPALSVMDAADVTWTTLTKTFRLAALYVAGSTPGTDDYLISYILLDNTPADISVSGINVIIQFNASGIVGLTRC